MILIEPLLHDIDRYNYYKKLLQDERSHFNFVYGARPKLFDLVTQDKLYSKITYIKILKIHQLEKVKELQDAMRRNLQSQKNLELRYRIDLIDNNLEVKKTFTILL